MPWRHQTYFAYFCVLAILATGCNQAESPLPPDIPTPHVVVVVGAGVDTAPNVGSAPRSQLNAEQGFAMWSGANAWFQDSRAEKLRQYVVLFRIADGGSEDAAEAIARQLQRDPRVLAVIGHASSGTTRAAAPIYAEAGIPVLMPIATSPTVQFPNCFRLPPNDVMGQAPALASVVTSRFKARRVYLVKDVSRDAPAYSTPLCDALAKLLHVSPQAEQKVSRDSGNFDAVAREILVLGPDIVIFCGYRTTAPGFMDALRRAYKDAPSTSKPTLLLTDGCMGLEFRHTIDFETYVTFPLPPLQDARVSPDIVKALFTAIDQDPSETYQIFGYDALRIVDQSIHNCIARGEAISRPALLADLRNSKFMGAFLPYEFRDGERRDTTYYLYHYEQKAKSADGKCVLTTEIPPTTEKPQ